MSIVQESHPLPIVVGIPQITKHPWGRTLLLLALLLCSVALYAWLISVSPRQDGVIASFVQVWMICFLPYFAACAFVLATKPAGGRWQWIELGIILGGALVVRAMLLPLPPGLSRDSWRYLWDARITLHGFSPYVYAPVSAILRPVSDPVLLSNMRFRNVPTIYPPGAQAIYLLSYLLAPSNLYFLKGIFVVFDMVTCGALAWFLAKKGLDPRRTILYAWCPLPVVEFAMNGHVDAAAVAFTLLTIISAGSTSSTSSTGSTRASWRGSRVLTGFLIGMATLTKIYPILLLFAVIRRRDWGLLTSCFATIILGYVPYLILGHGQVFGFFSTYASEQGGNAGIFPLVTYSISHALGFPLSAIVIQEYVVDLIVVGLVCLSVLVWRLFKLSMEAASLILIGTVLAVSSHVFPWYTTALLPWVAVLIGPLWTSRGPKAPLIPTLIHPCNAALAARLRLSRGERRTGNDAPASNFVQPVGKAPLIPTGNDAPASNFVQPVGKARGIAVGVSGYFICISVTGYFINTPTWHLYYLYAYDVVVIGLGIALLLATSKQVRYLYHLTLEGKPK